MNRMNKLELTQHYTVKNTKWFDFWQQHYGQLSSNHLTPAEEIGCTRFAPAEIVLRQFGETLHYYCDSADPDRIEAHLVELGDPETIYLRLPLTIAGAHELDAFIRRQLDQYGVKRLRTYYHIKLYTIRLSSEPVPLSMLYIYWYFTFRSLKSRGYKYQFCTDRNRWIVTTPQDLTPLARPTSLELSFKLSSLNALRLWCNQVEDPRPRIFRDILITIFRDLTPLLDTEPSFNQAQTSVIIVANGRTARYNIVPATYDPPHYFNDFHEVSSIFFSNTEHTFYIYDIARLLTSHLETARWKFTVKTAMDSIVTHDPIRGYTVYYNTASELSRFLSDLVQTIATVRISKSPKNQHQL